MNEVLLPPHPDMEVTWDKVIDNKMLYFLFQENGIDFYKARDNGIQYLYGMEGETVKFKILYKASKNYLMCTHDPVVIEPKVIR